MSEREIIPSHERIVKMPVVAVVGPPGAGKSTICSIIERNHGFKSYSVSSVIEELLQEEGLPPPYSRDQMRQKRQDTAAEYGSTAFIRAILEKGQSYREQHIINGLVIDGPRHAEEIVAIKRQRFSIVVSVSANRTLRYQRIRERSRAGDITSIDQLLEVERQEASIWQAMNHSEQNFTNDGNLGELEAKVARYFYQRFEP